MKFNENTALLTPKILLVPYSEHHVPTYHGWMQNEDLQKATASEPLTLPEEYAMQKSWRSDADKLTFIACTAPPVPLPISPTIESQKHDTPSTMIGDINLFLTPDSSSDSDSGSEGKGNENKEHMGKPTALIGEIEIMIASPSHQGLGLGHSILLTFLWYVISSLHQVTDEYSGGEVQYNSCVKYLRVKIDKDNVRSIRLFEKVRFRKVSEEANYFGEVELRWAVSAESMKEVEEGMECVPVIVSYK